MVYSAIYQWILTSNGLEYICLFCLHLVLNVLMSEINDTLFCVLIPQFVADVLGPSILHISLKEIDVYRDLMVLH